MSRKGVFTITNTKTGKVYIGSSNNNLDQRIYDYWQKLHAGSHSNPELQSDFNRYGSSNFSKEIVAICQTEAEVRKVTNQMFEKNKYKMYNIHRPSTYDGGNPNASFGESKGKRNNILEELIDIIYKSNLNSYNKQYLKKQVRNGQINNETELDKKIKSLSNKTRKESNTINTKNTSVYSKKKIHSNNRTQKRNRKKELIEIIYESKLDLGTKRQLKKQVKTGQIKYKAELNEKIKSLSNKARIESNTYNTKKTNIYSKKKIRDLANAYCQFSEFDTWEQQGNEIIFKQKLILFVTVKEKSIPINSLEKELNMAKNKKMYEEEKRICEEDISRGEFALYDAEHFDNHIEYYDYY